MSEESIKALTPKELYKLSVQISRAVLCDFFDAPNGFVKMESEPSRRKARKHVYDILAPLLLEPEVKKDG